MSLLKKYLGLIVGLAVVALIVIVWYETAKITGDVTVVGPTGTSVALSGARVTLYDVTEELAQRMSAALANFQQESQQEKPDNARVYSAASTDERTDPNVVNFHNLSDTNHCFALD